MAVFFKNEPYVLIQLEQPEDWLALYDICAGYLTEHDFLKLKEYLEQVAQTVVLEKGYIDADYRDTYFNFFSRKFAKYPSDTVRANFFTSKIAARMVGKLDHYQADYIGFTVLKPNRVSSIGRTVFDPRKLPFVNGHVCLAQYPVHILGAELIATGFPYMGQDTDVTICAHAACWMIFRYFSQRYSRYAEKWPYEVTQLTSDVSTGRLVPSKGLTAHQITEMFSNFGFSPEIYIRDQYPDLFDRLLYSYVESGLPVVVGLPGHAITIIGHQSDFSQLPQGAVTTSYDYLTGLLANDDNYMPYHAVRRDGPKPEGYFSNHQIKDINLFIVPLYEKIHLSAEHVFKLSEAILASHLNGAKAASQLLRYDQIVTRVFLTSSKSFKKICRQKTLPLNLSDVYCSLHMPKFIWVCEISTPELFQKGKVAGELIFDATANPNDRLAFLAIHYPDLLLLNDRDALTDNPDRFTVDRLDTDSIESYDCYISNLCEV
jgi:hypothetical protein